MYMYIYIYIHNRILSVGKYGVVASPVASTRYGLATPTHSSSDWPAFWPCT